MPKKVYNGVCNIVSTLDGAPAVTINQAQEDNIETGIDQELILNYDVQ